MLLLYLFLCMFLTATRFGKGAYFSTTSSYSDRFAVKDGDGYRWMFLAEVITGQYDQGNKDLVMAPYLPNSDAQYHSVVDDIDFPTMYVVFKDAAVYPLYILTYKV